MKTLTKTITAYSFNELDEFAREEAKKCILEAERLPEFFSDDLIEALIEDYGLYHLKTFYSLSNGQGDGLCLYGKITFAELFDNAKFKKTAFRNIHHKQIQSVSDELEKIDFIHKGSIYYHARTVSIESHVYEPTDRQMAIIEKVMDNVRKWYFEFCKEWEKLGYDYFHDITDELVSEICGEDNYLFTDEGILINRNEYVELRA
jgi:hypothetical protein